MQLDMYVTRIGAAVFFGIAIGFERQMTGHLAGIQTNALVCLGASIFHLTTFLYPQSDPTRVAAQIVTGVGFLGSGIIFKEGLNVKGINTAATIWCTAAVGILAGAGNILEAALASCVVIVTNIIFQRSDILIQQWKNKRKQRRTGRRDT